MNRRQYIALSAVIVLIAFLLREWYVLTVQVSSAIRGDSNEYMRYALNLVHHGVFSRAAENPTPDAFRSPGYPLLLAGVMKLAPEFRDWLRAVYQVQAVMGAATVALTIALARRWLPRGAALAAGLLIAVWPHHIVATGSVLSEVMFGLVLVAAMLAMAVALERGRGGYAAGACFAVAYLVNPLIALFPVLLLALYRNRVAMTVVAVLLVAVVGWGLRDAPSGGRAAINVVQGSWPEYHEAYRWRQVVTQYAKETAVIGAQSELAVTDPAAAFSQVGDRLASDPARYLRWYAVDKPLDLWGWSIQMGEGGIYFLRTAWSPFDGALAPLEVAMLFLNPLILLFAVIGAFNPRTRLAGLLFLYLTAIHVVFQAEPRYAIAYRAIECLLAVGGLSLLAGLARAKARPQLALEAG